MAVPSLFQQGQGSDRYNALLALSEDVVKEEQGRARGDRCKGVGYAAPEGGAAMTTAAMVILGAFAAWWAVALVREALA